MNNYQKTLFKDAKRNLLFCIDEIGKFEAGKTKDPQKTLDAIESLIDEALEYLKAIEMESE